jgi:hypothetical protein
MRQAIQCVGPRAAKDTRDQRQRRKAGFALTTSFFGRDSIGWTGADIVFRAGRTSVNKGCTFRFEGDDSK